MVETSPGFRSMLVGHDPPPGPAAGRVVRRLDGVHEGRGAGQSELTIASRVVRLPIAFDDSQSRRAVERYLRTIRPTPELRGRQEHRLPPPLQRHGGPRELYDGTATEFFTAFIGFFPGLPFMFPLDPRHAISAPKYNPTRTWTPEGAVGIGGPSVAIYPVESRGRLPALRAYDADL